MNRVAATIALAIPLASHPDAIAQTQTQAQTQTRTRTRTQAKPVTARPPAHAPHGAPAPPPAPAPPLPSLPTIARVRIDVARSHVIVTQDVTLPRGDWERGDIDLYVAFGAPGAPTAFDARLLGLPAGELEAPHEALGESLPVVAAPHAPISAQVLIGLGHMAGAIVHLSESAFARALVGSAAAVIRVRTLLDLPAEDARTGRELVVRLGVPGELPRTLGQLQIASLDPRPRVTRAEAALCGPEADPWPLAIALLSVRPASSSAPSAPTEPHSPPLRAPISPRMALRHATDDLCVRFWTAP